MEDPLVTSFDDNAVLLFEGLSDGLTLQDAVAAGKLVLQGLQIADAYVKAVFKSKVPADLSLLFFGFMCLLRTKR